MYTIALLLLNTKNWPTVRRGFFTKKNHDSCHSFWSASFFSPPVHPSRLSLHYFAQYYRLRIPPIPPLSHRAKGSAPLVLIPLPCCHSPSQRAHAHLYCTCMYIYIYAGPVLLTIAMRRFPRGSSSPLHFFPLRTQYKKKYIHHGRKKKKKGLPNRLADWRGQVYGAWAGENVSRFSPWRTKKQKVLIRFKWRCHFSRKRHPCWEANETRLYGDNKN